MNAGAKTESPTERGQGLGKKGCFGPDRRECHDPAELRLSARPAAAGRVVEADVAAAAVLAAAIERLAARLHDRAARLVAAAAGDAAAVGRVVALADAAGEVALANGQAVQGRAARAESAGERLAEVLQRGAGDFVVAVQWILNPSLHFSNRSLQRGTTHQLGAGAPVARPAGEGATAEFPAAPKNRPLSKTIVLDIETTPFKSRPMCNPSQMGCEIKDIDRLGLPWANRSVVGCAGTSFQAFQTSDGVRL